MPTTFYSTLHTPEDEKTYSLQIFEENFCFVIVGRFGLYDNSFAQKCNNLSDFLIFELTQNVR